jgi:hypothetical protein
MSDESDALLNREAAYYSVRLAKATVDALKSKARALAARLDRPCSWHDLAQQALGAYLRCDEDAAQG